MTEVRTLPALLDERARLTPNRLAFASDRERVTWRELSDRAGALAMGLTEVGLSPGDSAAVMGQTTGEWALADLGILCAGGVSVGVYPNLTPKQVAHLVNDSGAKVAFAGSQEELAVLVEAKRECPRLETLIGWGTAEHLGSQVLDYSTLLDRGRVLESAHPDKLERLKKSRGPDDVALVIYTSGTTGVPKGAMLSHWNCVFEVRSATPLLPPGMEREETVSFLPMAHVAEHVISHYGRISTGTGTRYVGSLASEKVLAALAKSRPTMFGSVPRIFEKAYATVRSRVAEASPAKRAVFGWAERVGRQVSRSAREGQPAPLPLLAQRFVADKLVLKRVRQAFGGRVKLFISGAARIEPEILEFFHAAGMLVLEVYGQTECTGVCTANSAERFRFGTVGLPLPGVEVRLASDGEVLVHGDNVFQGYLNLPEATKEALDAGAWLHTGDVGEIDRDGFLTITDRKKNLIVTAGGKKVAPAAIETLVATEPAVAATLVVGEGRPYITALIALDLEEARSAAGLPDAPVDVLARHGAIRERVRQAIERANSNLARFERVRRYLILPTELSIARGELTPTLKVRRRAVEERLGAEIEALYANPAGAEVENVASADR